MARPLTTISVAKARPEKARREVPDGLLPGLYLVVQPSGARSWAVRYRHAGRSRKHTIGSYPKIDLAAARDIARAALRCVAEGRDPAGEKKRASTADCDSFDAVARQFMDRHARPHTRSWRTTARILGLAPDKDQWRRTGGGAVALWGSRQITDVARRDVLDLIDSLIDAGTPAAANRALATVRKLFAWAASRDIIKASPCLGVKPPAPPRSRDRVLSDAELRVVWRAADAIGFPFGAMVKLLILTGQRRNEVAEMCWGEIDLSRALWTIPAARAKNKREHEVPLSTAAVAVLDGVPRIGGFVLTTNGQTPISGFSRAKRRLDDAGGALSPWTLHDLRRSAASGMARLGSPLPVIERALNHVSGSFAGIVGIYQKHSFADEMRAALEAWGAHVTNLVRE